MRLEQFESLAHPDAFDLNSKPLLIADGNSIDLDNLPSKVTAKSVCMARLNVADIHLICPRLNTTAIYLHRVHLTDYESFQSVKRLRYLEVYGNPQAVDYARKYQLLQ